MSRPPTTNEPKKGLSPLAWVAIGCLGLVALGVVAALVGGVFVFRKARQLADEIQDNPAVAAAKLLAAANPDIELVDVDEGAKIVTFRNTKTGEEYTIDFRDLEEGRVSFHSDDGSVSVEADAGKSGEGGLTITTDDSTARFGGAAGAGDFPPWLPVYPGSTPEGTFSSRNAEAWTGGYTIRAEDSLDAVIGYYVAELERAGLEILSRTSTPEGVVLTAQSPDEARTANVAASEQSGGVQVVVQFTATQ